MTDLLRFIPIFQETADSIRARLDADINGGLDEDDPRFVDTREGTFYFDMTETLLLELARVWDAISLEYPAAAFPLYSWGDYLDEHAATWGLVRKAAVPASGEVAFVGDPATVVTVGTIVSADPTSDEDDSIEFRTTANGTIGSALATPVIGSATPSGSGGTLTTATYYYVVTATNAFGETVGSAEFSAAVTGPTGSVAVNWPDVASATGYKVYVTTNPGLDYRLIGSPAVSNFTDTGGGGPLEDPPEDGTSAGVEIAVEAVLAGTSGNVGVAAITNLDTPNDGVSGVTNFAAMASGTDVESDDDLRDRILAEFEPQGAGTITDFKKWSLEVAGVGEVFVNPVTPAPGEVTVIVMDPDGNPVAGAIVTAVDDHLNNERVPIGYVANVSTPTATTINVTAATVTHETGYSLDGAGGSIATRELIEDALRQYVNNLQVGDDAIFNHVKAQFFSVEGVHEVTGLTVNGGTANIVIAADHVAVFGTATLT